MVSRAQRVRVTVIDQINDCRVNTILPADVTVARLLPHLVEALTIPTEGPGGAPIQYYLIHETHQGQAKLQEDQTLAQAGVHDGSTLRILPQMRTRDGSDTSQMPGEEWRYLDFELQIISTRGGYQTEVLASPGGEACEPFEALDDQKAEIFVLRMGQTRRGVRSIGSPQWTAAKQLGQELFQRLFHGEITACFSASIREAQNQECGLRIKLRLEKVPELMNLPWEFLYDSSRRRFLALNEETPLVRFISVREPHRAMRVKLPLRILAMVADPVDLPALSVAQERGKLAAAMEPLVSSGAVMVDWVEGGSMSALYRHLVASRERYHVFHFIGHGGFEGGSGAGFLAMVGPGGRHEPITGERLAPLLRVGRQRLRLIVLKACEGGRIDLADPFAGVATSLVLTCGLPAVIAMQFEITDSAAIAFAESFYRALSTGRPVDAAITAARVAISCTGNDVEWGTPVLYMRSPDGQLFDLLETKQQPRKGTDAIG